MSWSSDDGSGSEAHAATPPRAHKASLSAVLRRPSPDTGGLGGSGILPTAHGPLPKAQSDVGGMGSRPDAPPPASLDSPPGDNGALRMARLGIDLSAEFQSDEDEDDSVELKLAQLATKHPPLPSHLSSPPPPSSSTSPQHPNVGKDGKGDGSAEKELDLPSDYDEAALEGGVAPPPSHSGGVVPSPSHVSAHTAKHGSGTSGQVPSLKPKLDIDEDFDSATDSEAELPKPQSEVHRQVKADQSSPLQRGPPKGEEWSDVSEGGDDGGFLVASGRRASKYFADDSGSGDDEEMPQKQLAVTSRSTDLAAEMFGLAKPEGRDDDEESEFDSDVDLPEGGGGGYVPSAFGEDGQQRSSTALVEEGSEGQTPGPVSPPVKLAAANTPSSSLLSPTSPTQTVVVTPLTTATCTPLVLDHQEGDVTMATQPDHPVLKGELDFDLDKAESRGGVGPDMEEGEGEEEEEEGEGEEESDWDSEKEEEDEGGKGVEYCGPSAKSSWL